MAEPENILDFLLRQPRNPQVQIPMAQVGENATALAKGELPPGTDINALLTGIVSKQEENAAESTILNAEVMRLVQGNRELEGQVSTAMSNLNLSMTDSLPVSEEQIRTQGEINLDVVTRNVGLDADLQEAINARDTQRQADEAQLNVTFEEMVTDYNKLNDANEIGFLDILQNPIKSIKTSIEAEEAQGRLKINRRMIQALDAKNQVAARLHQEKVDSYNVQKTLAVVQNVDLYAKNAQLTTASQIMQNRSANYTQVLDNLGKFYGLKNQQLAGVEGQLRILAEQGRLNATSLDSLLKAEQYKHAQLQYTETKRQYDENEGVRTTFDAKFAEIGRSLGMPEISSFASYNAAKESGMITDEVQTLVQTVFASGTLGTPAVFNATNSWQTAQAIMSTEPELIPERMQEFLMTVDTHIKNSAEYQQALTESDTQRQQEGINNVRSNYLQTWRQALDLDIDVATRGKLFDIMSPHNMELERIPGMPVETLETFKKMRLNTSSFDAFSVDAINAIVGDPLTSQIKPQDYEKFATGMAAIAKYQFDGLNRNTGLTVQYMRNARFVNPITGRPGDARNPNDWMTLIQQRRQNIINASRNLK
jgi:hypothetical protein